MEGEDGTVGAGKTGEEINIVEGGDNNRLGELPEERTLLAESVKIDCTGLGKKSKSHFHNMTMFPLGKAILL